MNGVPTIGKIYSAESKEPAFWLRELCVQLRANNDILSDISRYLKYIAFPIKEVDQTGRSWKKRPERY